MITLKRLNFVKCLAMYLRRCVKVNSANIYTVEWLFSPWKHLSKAYQLLGKLCSCKQWKLNSVTTAQSWTLAYLSSRVIHCRINVGVTSEELKDNFWMSLLLNLPGWLPTSSNELIVLEPLIFNWVVSYYLLKVSFCFAVAQLITSRLIVQLTI